MGACFQASCCHTQIMTNGNAPHSLINLYISALHFDKILHGNPINMTIQIIIVQINIKLEFHIKQIEHKSNKLCVHCSLRELESSAEVHFFLDMFNFN